MRHEEVWIVLERENVGYGGKRKVKVYFDEKKLQKYQLDGVAHWSAERVQVRARIRNS